MLAWGKVILKFTEKWLLFSEKRLFEVTMYFHAKVFMVKLFKARYFERRIYLKSTQLKQNQNNVNSANLLKRYTYTTNSIKISWSSGLFLNACHIEDLNSKNVQSLLTMSKDGSFGNIFWSYNFRVFDTMKFVTFQKS